MVTGSHAQPSTWLLSQPKERDAHDDEMIASLLSVGWMQSLMMSLICSVRPSERAVRAVHIARSMCM